MTSVAVFLTHEEARIFKFTPKGVETHKLHLHGPKHHHETQGRNHPKQGDDADHFFHELANYLAKDDAGHWLIVGPGLAKNHFQHHVEKHHKSLSSRIYGVEALDKSTDGEILNFARDYFKKKGVFGAI